uniref:Serine aminopeptidase S33 domain-containing protein n=1 Tax=Fagus sylvatica TaxID=28930 RepID=A0A2N9EP89_FAGSY
MAQAAQNPVVQQKVIIPNKYGEKLVGILHETGSVEIVILCHGFQSSKEYNVMVNLAVSLGNEGISAFRFDFAGNGESEGTFQFANYYREVDDLHAVIQHFSGAKRVISAIVGHSKGGNVVLLYPSKYHDIHTVVNLSGRYDLKKGIEERLGKDFMQRIKEDGFVDIKNKTGSVDFRVTEESLLERLSTNMHEACLQIDKECRVLTVHGSADEVIPVQDALEFAKIMPNHKLHVVEGADHGYTSYQAELVPVVLNFIKSALQQDKGNHSSTRTLKMAQAAQNPVVQQKVIIPNKYGEKLVGILHETGSLEIVILCHGAQCTKEYSIMVNLAVSLGNEGISAFRFDFSGNGESEGSSQSSSFWKEVDDLHAVIQHFSGANRVISAILGHSKGGCVVLLYASKYHDIHTVVNVSGRYDLQRGIEERLGKDFMQRIKEDGFIDVKNKTGGVDYRVTEESLLEHFSTNMHDACLQIDKECRVLTVHGSADEINPVQDALEFAKIIPNHKLHIIEGADHGYTAYQAELISVVLNFIKAALQQDKGATS